MSNSVDLFSADVELGRCNHVERKDRHVHKTIAIRWLLLALLLPAAKADEAEIFKESFEGKTTLKWKVIRPVEDHVSLKTHPGKLTITTQRGTIHGDEENDAFSAGTKAKNIYLVDREIPADADFVATIAIHKFEPQLFYHQVGLLAYQDDDNYAKWSMEKTSSPQTPTQALLVCENNSSPTHNMQTPIEVDGPFWLRFERTGPEWICRHSTDGKSFQAVGVHTWQFQDTKRPIRVGFLAKNGGNPAAAEIDVVIDSFELKVFAPVVEKAVVEKE